MRLSVGEIRDKVQAIADERASFVKGAKEDEKLWSLRHYKTTAEDKIKTTGQEQVLIPMPYNVVGLARRLMATEPKIEVPSIDGSADRDDRSELIERFMTAFYELANRQQERIILADAVWYQLVRGRCCFMVQWVKDWLPHQVQQTHLPISIRTPDPLDVGVFRTEYYTEYAYHRYNEEIGSLRRRFSRVDFGTDRMRGRDDKYQLEVIDFWYRGKRGEVWHAVIVDDQFAIPPAKTNYPDIPIIEVLGDSTPLRDEGLRGQSLLFPVRDTFKYYSRLASNMGTAVLQYAWPTLLWYGPGLAPDLKVGPGQIVPIPKDSRLEQLRYDVNEPLVQSMMGMVQNSLSESTFPAVMYGNSPGELQAGYGISLLADQARGRVQMFQANMEMGLAKVNAIILALIEAMAEEEGVEVWGKNTADNRMFRTVLKPSDIKQNYSNMVTLKPSIPQDDIQAESINMQKVSNQLMSRRTFRDKGSSMAMPSDEETRILVEQAQMHPDIQARMSARAIVEANPDDWQDLIVGTALEMHLGVKAQIKLAKWKADQAQRAQKAGLPPPGMMPQPGMGGPQGAPGMGGPPGMPPQGMMPQGGPPMQGQGQPGPGADPMQMVMGMMQQGAPPDAIMQQLMQAGVPHEVAVQMIQQGMQMAQQGGGPPQQGPAPQQGQGQPQLPPIEQVVEAIVGMLQQGTPPEQIVQMLVENGIPPEAAMQLVQQVIQQAGAGDMQPQGIAGVPPAMAGQMTPQMMGITPQMQQDNPGLFQQMMGQGPMSPEDQLDDMLGLPEV